MTPGEERAIARNRFRSATTNPMIAPTWIVATGAGNVVSFNGSPLAGVPGLITSRVDERTDVAPFVDAVFAQHGRPLPPPSSGNH